MNKSILIFFIIAFGLSLGLAYWLYLLTPVSGDSAVRLVVIESGQSFNSISDELSAAGLLRSREIFKFYSLLSGSARSFKAGEYAIPSSLGVSEIVRLLVVGPPDIKIAITEGESMFEIDVKLSRAGIIQSKQLLNFDWKILKKTYEFLAQVKSLEGFLFPDTYFIAPKSSLDGIVRKFLENFQNKAWPELTKNKLPISTYKLLILASIIEKEVPLHNDRLLVSGILQKRLEIGMPLQVDVELWTYQNYGLPSKPIANPGIDAIFAALHPKPSSYLYYLSDPKTKKTIFSETLEEHNDNRARYLSR